MILIAGCSSSQSPVMTNAPVLTTSPTHFSGSSDGLIPFTATGAGLREFRVGCAGTSTCIISLKDSNGEETALGGRAYVIFNDNAYSETKSVSLSSGKYSLDVIATGPWTVDISSP